MPTDNSAEIARLTVEVAHLAAAVSGLVTDVTAIRRQLDEARGGAAVLRWVVGGSLAAFLGLAATLYTYLKGAAH